MVEPAVILAGAAVVGLSPSAAVLGVRHRAAQQWPAGLTSHRLDLPADLDYRSVEGFLAGLAGLLPSRWLRPVTVRGLILEVTADEAGITHRLLTTATARDSVLSGLRANLPSISITPEPDYRSATPTLAGELVSTNSRHQLQVDRPETTASAILSALHPLEEGETLTVQYLLLPQGHVRPPQPTPAVTGNGGRPQSVAVPKAVRDKFAKALFGVAIRIGVTSPNPERDRQLLRRLNAAFAAAASEHARLRRRWQASRYVAQAMTDHLVPTLDLPCRLNTAELTGLLAWPAAGTSLPGMHLAGTRQLPPSAEIARKGRIVAVSTYPGMAERPLAVSAVDALRHTYVIGPTGVGKSTLLVNSIIQDLEAGQGGLIIDGKGQDLINDVLAHIPAHRTDDVIVLDPADDERPVGFNLLAAGVNSPDLAAEQLVSIFHRQYATSWGPRSADILTSAALTLATVPGSTVADIPVILTNDHFRERMVAQLDPTIALGVRPFWSWFGSLKEGERNQIIAPVLNKSRAILVRPRLRRTLGQGFPKLDFDDVLASGKIVLVPLSAGLLGEDAVGLLASLVLANFWLAVQRRAGLPHDQRRPAFCYIDEFQVAAANVATPLGDLLVQARSMSLGLVVAHQHLGQLTGSLREAVLANCATQIYFRTAAADAGRLSREVPPLAATDLQNLGNWEVVARLATQGRTSSPVTGRTQPVSPATSDPEAIRQRSRERYGQDAGEVDDELRRRHEQPTGSGPIGRQRRAS